LLPSNLSRISRPIFAFGQHYFFKQPFSRKDFDEDDIILSDDMNPPNELQTPKPGKLSAAMKVNIFNMGQKGQQPVSTRVTTGSSFGFANTNRPVVVNSRNGVGVGPRPENDLVDRVTNSGLWDSFKRK
jgi:hypothetical protein